MNRSAIWHVSRSGKWQKGVQFEGILSGRCALLWILDGCDHFLDCLPGDAEFTGDISLCIAFGEKRCNDRTPLSGKLHGMTGMLNCSCTDRSEIVKHGSVFDCYNFHAVIMTTPGCGRQPPVVTRKTSPYVSCAKPRKSERQMRSSSGTIAIRRL